MDDRQAEPGSWENDERKTTPRSKNWKRLMTSKISDIIRCQVLYIRCVSRCVRVFD